MRLRMAARSRQALHGRARRPSHSATQATWRQACRLALIEPDARDSTGERPGTNTLQAALANVRGLHPHPPSAPRTLKPRAPNAGAFFFSGHGPRNPSRGYPASF
jgi:hypothetical protein